MKTFLPFLMLVFTWINPANPVAGQTITDIIPQPGQIFTVAITTFSDTGPVGSGVTWDFSDFELSDAYQVSIMAGPDAPYGDMFPGNAIVVSVAWSESFINYPFYDFSQNSWNLLGISSSIGSYVLYENPHELVTLPLTPESSGSDTFEYIIDINEGVWTGTSEWEVDGSGTLILPNATYENVLRVRTENTELGFGQGGDLEIEISRTYHRWYANGIPHPLLTLSEESVHDFDSGDTFYLKTAEVFVGFTVSVVDQNPEFSPQIFPNPAKDQLGFSIAEEFGRIRSFTISDLSGKVLLHKNIYSPNGTVSVDVSALSSGVYMLGVEGEGNSAAARFVKE